MIAVNSDEEEKSRRPQQEGPWPRRLDPLLQLLAHVPQGQSAFNSLSMSASAD
jgi:hypothetical protein